MLLSRPAAKITLLRGPTLIRTHDEPQNRSSPLYIPLWLLSIFGSLSNCVAYYSFLWRAIHIWFCSLYISFELRCLLSFSVAWEGELVADMSTVISDFVSRPHVFAHKRVSLPSVWVLLYAFPDDRDTEWSNTILLFQTTEYLHMRQKKNASKCMYTRLYITENDTYILVHVSIPSPSKEKGWVGGEITKSLARRPLAGYRSGLVCSRDLLVFQHRAVLCPFGIPNHAINQTLPRCRSQVGSSATEYKRTPNFSLPQQNSDYSSTVPVL